MGKIILIIFLLFYILPIVTIKCFNRWTSHSERLIDDDPAVEDLIMSFCPLMNIVIALIVLLVWVVDKANKPKPLNRRIKKLLTKIIT